MKDPFNFLKNLQDAEPEERTTLCQSLDNRLLDDWLSSDNWKIRNAAVKIIGMCGRKEYIETLIEILTDRRPAKLIDRLLGGRFYHVGFIRRNAASALGRIAEPDETVAAAIVAAMKDRYWEVRVEAIKACRNLFAELPEPVDTALRNTLTDRDFEVLREAVLTLGLKGTGTHVLQSLKPLYDHPNVLVKAAIIEAIKTLFQRGIITSQEVVYKEISNIFVPGKTGINKSSI